MKTTEVSAAPATTSEAARIARCSEDTIRKAVDTGRLAAVRTATGLRLIDRQALAAFAAARQ